MDDPNQSARASNLVSNADPRSSSAALVQPGQDWRIVYEGATRTSHAHLLGQKLERLCFPHAALAARHSEENIWNQATNYHEYATNLRYLFHTLESLPETPQRYPGSHIPFPNQYQINQVMGMVPHQWGSNTSGNIAMPIMNQPSTSRQQLRQPLLQGFANDPRTIAGGPAGPIPVSTYSYAQRQQETQLRSQIQMVPPEQLMMQQNQVAFQQQQIMPVHSGSGLSYMGMMPPQWGSNTSGNIVMPMMNQPSTSRQQLAQPLLQGFANDPWAIDGGPAGPIPASTYSYSQTQLETQLQSQIQMVSQEHLMMQQNQAAFEQQQIMPVHAGSGLSYMGMMPPQWDPITSENIVMPMMNQPSTSREQLGQPLLLDFANGPSTIAGGSAGPIPVSTYSDAQREQETQLQSQIQMVSQDQLMMQQNQVAFEQQPIMSVDAGSGLSSSAVDLTDEEKSILLDMKSLMEKTCGRKLKEIAQELSLLSIQVIFFGENYPSYECDYECMTKEIEFAEKNLNDLLAVFHPTMDISTKAVKDKLYRFEELTDAATQQARQVIAQGRRYLDLDEQPPLLQPDEQPQAGQLADDSSTIISFGQNSPEENLIENMSADMVDSFSL